MEHIEVTHVTLRTQNLVTFANFRCGLRITGCMWRHFNTGILLLNFTSII